MKTTINLLHSQAIDFSFHRYTIQEITENKVKENLYNFDFVPIYDQNDKTKFSILFTLDIDQVKEYKLAVKYIAWFNASNDVDKTLIKNGFTVINAPAIAFPYLRSFITTLIVSAGYKPLILPSINFTETKQAKSLQEIKA